MSKVFFCDKSAITDQVRADEMVTYCGTEYITLPGLKQLAAQLDECDNEIMVAIMTRLAM